jgi:hypothetical protein
MPRIRVRVVAAPRVPPRPLAVAFGADRAAVLRACEIMGAFCLFVCLYVCLFLLLVVWEFFFLWFFFFFVVDDVAHIVIDQKKNGYCIRPSESPGLRVPLVAESTIVTLDTAASAATDAAANVSSGHGSADDGSRNVAREVAREVALLEDAWDVDALLATGGPTCGVHVLLLTSPPGHAPPPHAPVLPLLAVALGVSFALAVDAGAGVAAETVAGLRLAARVAGRPAAGCSGTASRPNAADDATDAADGSDVGDGAQEHGGTTKQRGRQQPKQQSKQQSKSSSSAPSRLPPLEVCFATLATQAPPSAEWLATVGHSLRQGVTFGIGGTGGEGCRAAHDLLAGLSAATLAMAPLLDDSSFGHSESWRQHEAVHAELLRRCTDVSRSRSSPAVTVASFADTLGAVEAALRHLAGPARSRGGGAGSGSGNGGGAQSAAQSAASTASGSSSDPGQTDQDQDPSTTAAAATTATTAIDRALALSSPLLALSLHRLSLSLPHAREAYSRAVTKVLVEAGESPSGPYSRRVHDLGLRAAQRMLTRESPMVALGPTETARWSDKLARECLETWRSRGVTCEATSLTGARCIRVHEIGAAEDEYVRRWLIFLFVCLFVFF